MVVENASTNITSFDEQIQALSWDSRCFRRRLFYDDRRKRFFYDDRRKRSTNSTSGHCGRKSYYFDISPPPISTPPVILGVYTTRQPYATVIDGGVGREGSRVRRLFTRCPKALAAANIMDHVLLRLPRSLSGGADRAPSFILHQS